MSRAIRSVSNWGRLTPVLITLVILLPAGRAAAEPSDSDRAWVQAVLERSGTADDVRQQLGDCLLEQLDGGRARLAALTACAEALLAVAPPPALTAQVEALAARVQGALETQGMPPAERAGLATPLTTCLTAWGEALALGGQASLPDDAAAWCFADLSIAGYQPLAQEQPAAEAAPRIGSLRCPAQVEAGTAVACSATVENTATSATLRWSASSGSSGSGAAFSFTPGDGDVTVTLEVCNPVAGGAAPQCARRSQEVRVAAAPRLTITCSPTTGTAPLEVSCVAAVTGGASTTTVNWSATGGGLTSGTGERFTTRYTAAGTYTITATACTGARCVARSVEIRVEAGGGLDY